MGDTLEAWVMHDHKPITARLLAVQQRIHVDEARARMQAFLDQHAESSSKPFATWLLIGQLAPVEAVLGDGQKQDSQDSMDVEGSQTQMQSQEIASIHRMGMLLTDEAHLEESKRHFTGTPKLQLYALSPPLSSAATVAHKIAAVSAITTIQHDLKNDAAHVKTWNETGNGAELGAIQAPADVHQVGKDPIPPVASTSRNGPSTSVPAPKKGQLAAKVQAAQPSAAGKDESKVPVKKEKPVSSNTKPKRKLIDSDDEADHGKSKTAEMDEDGDDIEDDGPIGYADVPATSKTGANDEKIGAPHKRADASDKRDSAKEEERRRRRQELMDMMDDDGDEDPDVKAAPSASTSTMKGNAEQARKSKPGTKKRDLQAAGADESPSAQAKEAGKDVKTPEAKVKRRVRKQRKVIRKETTRNEKGYRVTRDVEAYESYSSEESDDEDTSAKSKNGPAKASAKTSAPAAAKTEREAEAVKPVEPSPEPAEESKTKSAAPNAPAAAAQQQAKRPAATGASGGAAAGGSGQRKLSSFFAKKK